MKTFILNLALCICISNVAYGQFWAQQDKVQPVPPYENYINYDYSSSVEIEGQIAVVGAEGFNSNTGIAYVLEQTASGWDTLGLLSASDAEYGDNFGCSVGISGDVIVVGADGKRNGGWNYSGAVYVFNKPLSGWETMAETAKLTPSDPGQDYFGNEVDISGDVIIAGSYMDDDNGGSSGSAYVFEKPDVGWEDMTESAKFAPSNGAGNDRFGISVGISGETIIVGAHNDDDNGPNSGSAYIFKKPASGWEGKIAQTAQLNPSTADDGDSFGCSVAIFDGVAVVGAENDDEDGSNSGSVFIFVEPAGGWADGNEDARIHPATTSTSAYFGRSVDIVNGWIIVGGTAGYVFKKPTTGWSDATTEEVKLYQSDAASGDQFGYQVAITDVAAIVSASGVDDADLEAGSVYMFDTPPDKWGSVSEISETSKHLPYHNIESNNEDLFGSAVDIKGDYAIVGSPGYKFNSGRAHVLKKDAGSWDTIAILTPSDEDVSMKFGISVAISENIVFVGAIRANGTLDDAGAVYVFEKSLAGWQSTTETDRITASDGEAYDEFGSAIDYYHEDSILVVGAIRDDDNGSGSGSAYVFKNNAGTWSQVAKLKPSDGSAFEEFGNAVAISADAIIIGSSNDGAGGIRRGSAYIFEKPTGGWTDMTETGKFTASNSRDYDYFGCAVAIADTLAVVGAYEQDDASAGAGMVYVFKKPAGGWATSTESAQLRVFDPEMGEWLGVSVDIEDELILAGASRKRISGAYMGAVYVFKMPESGWADGMEDTILLADDMQNGDKFGQAVAISGNNIIVGSPYTDANGASAGTAYLFEGLPPRVTTQPVDQAGICFVDSIVFALEAMYAETYQWQISDDNGVSFTLITDGTGYRGSLTDSLIIRNPATLEGNLYRCIVGNGAGEVVSDTVMFNFEQVAPVPDIAQLNDILAGCSIEITEYPTATDNCSGTITATTTDPLEYTEQGIDTITWMYEDENGNLATQIQRVVIMDNIPPVPDLDTLPVIHGECSVVVTGYPTATDECSGAVIATTGDTLYYYEQGMHTITWVYTDSLGNSSTQQQVVLVSDTIPPVPDGDTLLPVFARGCVDIIKVPTAYSCGEEIPGTTSDPLSYSEDGEYTINWNFEDASGNILQQEQLVILNDTIINPVFEEKLELTAPDASRSKRFGQSMSAHGDYLVVGTGSTAIGDSGSVYVYKKNYLDWEIDTVLYDTSRYFGSEVFLHGDYLFIGDPYAEHDGAETGAVHIYKNTGTVWNKSQVLVETGLANRDMFGKAIAANEETLLIGAPGDDKMGGNAGCVYQYVLSEESWTFKQALHASNPGNNAEFGKAIEIEGNFAVVGAPMHFSTVSVPYRMKKTKDSFPEVMLKGTGPTGQGAAYILKSDGNQFNELAFLTASDKTIGDYFGCAVDITDEWVVIGAYADNDTGSVYLFKKHEDGWQESTETTKLTGTSSLGRFGYDISLDSNLLAVGAKYDSEHFVHGGSMSVFMLNDTVWDLTGKVFPVELKEHDYFGSTVEITGGQLFGSAIGDDDAGNYSGAVHVFGATNPCIINESSDPAVLCGIDTASFSVTAENISLYEWQVSADGGMHFATISDDDSYSGTRGDSVTIHVNHSMNDFMYRCVLYNDGYTDTTNTFALNLEEESPVIESMPDDLEFFLEEGCTISLLDYTGSVSFTDNCDDSPDIVQSPLPGTLVSGSANTIVLTATDDAGNSSDVSFTISVTDTTAPTITCLKDTVINISLADNHYRVAGSEFHPLMTDDNCEVTGVVNDFNGSESLTGEELSPGVHIINWTVTDASGNQSNCAINIEIRQSLGLNMLTTLGVDVYPNPAKDEIFITDKNAIIENVTMYDISGRPVLTIPFISSMETINISHLANGVYMVELKMKEKVLITKIIKK